MTYFGLLTHQMKLQLEAIHSTQPHILHLYAFKAPKSIFLTITSVVLQVGYISINIIFFRIPIGKLHNWSHGPEDLLYSGMRMEPSQFCAQSERPHYLQPNSRGYPSRMWELLSPLNLCSPMSSWLQVEHQRLP